VGCGWELDDGAVIVVGPRPIRGVVGRIDWGYFAAAAINGYSLRRQADGTWALRGVVVSCDAFKINQRPLTFVAPHAHGEWRWPVKTVDLGCGSGPRECRATLGPQLPEMMTGGGSRR
jgi:hypothetical protein